LIARILSDTGLAVETVRGSFVGWELPVLLLGVAFVLTQPNVHERWDRFRPTWRSYVTVTASAIGAIAIIGRDSAWLYGAF